MSTTAAWRWCLAAGLLAFACSVGFGRIPGLHPCGEANGLGAIIAFEFARTPADVAALFGGKPCRSALVVAQRTGLWLDALGFIPSYTAFLCLAAWAAGRRRALPVIVALLLAGLSDEVEGALLFSTLRHLPGDQPTLDALGWAVRLKFLLLGLGTLAIAVLLLASGRLRLTDWMLIRIVGALGIGFGAVQALRGLFEMPDTTMMSGFTLAWFVLLMVAAFRALWSLRQRPAARPPAPAPPSA